MGRHQQLDALLQELENCLRNNQQWSVNEPDPEALASQEPFACDHLQFTEWLQFIFIPRLRELIVDSAALPEHCQVAPMAEVFYSQSYSNSAPVLRVISAIDALISGE